VPFVPERERFGLAATGWPGRGTHRCRKPTRASKAPQSLHLSIENPYQSGTFPPLAKTRILAYIRTMTITRTIHEERPSRYGGTFIRPQIIQEQIDALRRQIAHSPDSYQRREAQADLDFLLKIQKDTGTEKSE
jgi:hypothetical protein